MILYTTRENLFTNLFSCTDMWFQANSSWIRSTLTFAYRRVLCWSCLFEFAESAHKFRDASYWFWKPKSGLYTLVIQQYTIAIYIDKKEIKAQLQLQGHKHRKLGLKTYNLHHQQQPFLDESGLKAQNSSTLFFSFYLYICIYMIANIYLLV